MYNNKMHTSHKLIYNFYLVQLLWWSFVLSFVGPKVFGAQALFVNLFWPPIALTSPEPYLYVCMMCYNNDS